MQAEGGKPVDLDLSQEGGDHIRCRSARAKKRRRNFKDAAP